MHPGELRIEDFTYDLADERIARYPLAERDASRLLVYRDGQISEDTYRNLAAHVPANTTMVFNQARVVHARLLFQKETGSTIEVFCLAPHEQYGDIQTAMHTRGEVLWECLVGGASKWKKDTVPQMVSEEPAFTLTAYIEEKRANSYILRLKWTDEWLTFAEVLHYMGKVPLPPYLRRNAEQGDETTYQTIFAKDEGSVAAPTAGLHFTPRVMDELAGKGIGSAFVTLHVGAGTFIPVKAETMQDHNMHAEWIEVTTAAVQQLISALNGNIVAVGTTSLRTIETLYWLGNKILNKEPLNLQDISIDQWDAYTSRPNHDTAAALTALLHYMKQHDMERLITRTRIMIAPGYDLRVANGIVTNFHQPQSTLLLLVAAIIGNDWHRVYDHALNNGYRFLSYGDGSLLWKR
ncbi:MAG: S-adenosylmethionine:tRNA ribosyltransferase-isomerase [Chitinophagaceae bacterium]|nr:S-adenosylmethionine:tRNA ribosyltransferase-isomerase [Chitinophagaceae bacterium]